MTQAYEGSKALAFTYLLGLTTRDGSKSFPPAVARGIVRKHLDSFGLGCTIHSADGSCPSYPPEKTLMIYVSGIGRKAHEDFVDWLGEHFDQGEIAVRPEPPLRFFKRRLRRSVPSAGFHAA